MCANTRRPSGTIATPHEQTRWVATPQTSVPPTAIRPRVRVWSRAMALTRVDFPAPLGPMTQTVSPAPTSRSTSHSTRASPWNASSRRTSSTDAAPAEIGPDHRRIAHHRARLAVGQHGPAVEHDHAGGQLVDHAEQVLDDDDRRAGAVDPA